VTAPIVEEIVFRGYLFAALTRWRGPWPAAVITGVLFGAAHGAVHPPVALVPLAILGFALCLVYWFTGSLLPCIGLHAANNAMVLGIEVGWSWQVPLAMLGAVAVSLLLVAPFTKGRAPQYAHAGA
jgi:membrane protease YdiL (CAAX protease family)